MKYLHTARATAVTLLAIASLSAHAQTKQELVQKVIVLQRPSIEALARQLAEQPAVQIAESARRVLQTRVPAEKREAAAKAADAELKKYLDEAVPIVRDKALQQADGTLGPILTEKFDEDELKQLIAWIESPVSKKFTQVIPELNAAMAQKLVADTRPQIEPRIRALDANLAKVMGIPPAGGAASGGNTSGGSGANTAPAKGR